LKYAAFISVDMHTVDINANLSIIVQKVRDMVSRTMGYDTPRGFPPILMVVAKFKTII
jgi:hypothetical protein